MVNFSSAGWRALMALVLLGGLNLCFAGGFQAAAQGVAPVEGQEEPAPPTSPDGGQLQPPTEDKLDIRRLREELEPQEAEPGEGEAPQITEPAGQAEPQPEILYDPALLPPRVAEMRRAIMAAAQSGRIEELRPVMEMNEMPPAVTHNEVEDPIESLLSASGDEEGYEILAILLNILEAGFVHVDAGTPQEMYVWPYFARTPLESLTPAQWVELYKILTAQDVAEMAPYGAYIFYRIGIGPDGTWHYFVAGD